MTDAKLNALLGTYPTEVRRLASLIEDGEVMPKQIDVSDRPARAIGAVTIKGTDGTQELPVKVDEQGRLVLAQEVVVGDITVTVPADVTLSGSIPAGSNEIGRVALRDEDRLSGIVVTPIKKLDLKALDGLSTMNFRGYFSVCRDEQGTLHAVYYAGNAHAFSDGSTIMYTWSSDDGATWNTPEALLPPETGERQGNPQITSNPERGLVLVSFDRVIGGVQGAYVAESRSVDPVTGKRIWGTFHALPVPTGFSTILQATKAISYGDSWYLCATDSLSENTGIALIANPNMAPTATTDWAVRSTFTNISGQPSEPWIWRDVQTTIDRPRIHMIIRQQTAVGKYRYSTGDPNFPNWSVPVNINVMAYRVAGRPAVYQLEPYLYLLVARNGNGRISPIYIATSRDGVNWSKPMFVQMTGIGYGDLLRIGSSWRLWLTAEASSSPESWVMEYDVAIQR